MTKKRLKQLQDVQSRLITGINYIKRDSTIICSNRLPNATSYYNKEGEGISPMNKEIGSDLCYLYSALANLTAIILSEQNINVPQTLDVE